MSVAPSGDLLSPVPVTGDVTGAVAAPVAAAAPKGPQGNFDFEGDDRPSDQGPAPAPAAAPSPAPSKEDPLALQAKMLGVPGENLSGPSLGGVPDLPTATGAFGVRVLATLTDVQPPRVILGMPDGSEVVLQPGGMIQASHLVVLAIGRSGVQVATIEPQGWATHVETAVLPVLYPAGPPAAPPVP